MKKSKMKIKGPSQWVGVRMPNDLKDKIDALAEKRYCGASAIVREAVAQYFEQKGSAA